MKALIFYVLFCMLVSASAFANTDESVNVDKSVKKPEVVYEVPRNRLVSEVLDGQIIQGPHYTIDHTVSIYDGFMHHFTVDSDFGKFEVTGDSALYKLLHEIKAIADLQEVKKARFTGMQLRNLPNDRFVLARI